MTSRWKILREDSFWITEKIVHEFPLPRLLAMCRPLVLLKDEYVFFTSIQDTVIKSLVPIVSHCLVVVVVQSPSRVWLCNPMDCSIPSLLVPHHLSKFAQVHIHCIGDAFQLSHPLKPSSPSAFNHSKHRGLFQWVFHQRNWTIITQIWKRHGLMLKLELSLLHFDF